MYWLKTWICERPVLWSSFWVLLQMGEHKETMGKYCCHLLADYLNVLSGYGASGLSLNRSGIISSVLWCLLFPICQQIFSSEVYCALSTPYWLCDSWITHPYVLFSIWSEKWIVHYDQVHMYCLMPAPQMIFSNCMRLLEVCL